MVRRLCHAFSGRVVQGVIEKGISLMRYVFSCVVIVTATGILHAVAAEATECDVIRPLVDHSDRCGAGSGGHGRREAAATGVTIKGRVAEGETILITTLLPAVGDVFRQDGKPYRAV